ncbi:MAG: alpha/beta hydrolase, partial [Chitinophagaceae bacterium]|nr:alpha/beta hydrolase [Chitinophagaceae bacterium]
MRFNNILLAFTATIGIMVGTSCQKDDTEEQNGTQSLVVKDMSYGNDPAQKMDVYLPANRNSESTPAIFLIHGGAWIGGDKSEFDTIVQTLQQSLPDYAIFNINYRLVSFIGSNGWPDPLNDVDSAFSFAARKATEYQFNPQKLALIGASAGAHLGLLKAYSLNTGNNIKVVVDLFGPADIADLYNNPPDPALPGLLSFFMNGGPDVNAVGYRAASPIFQVTAAAPPTIIFHGTLDGLVPVYQSDSLHKRLVKANV